MNLATHGINVYRAEVEHPMLQTRQVERLSFSVWDFAGQHDYYNSHHYFLSSRAVYLFVWDLTAEAKGLAGLEFWFASLRCHLPEVYCDEKGRPLYSILVVGTHLDGSTVHREGKGAREEAIRAIGEKHGFKCRVGVLEVSSATMEGVMPLKTAILREALSHAYLGEMVPESYRLVAQALESLAEERCENIPLVALPQLVEHVKLRHSANLELETVRRALTLLTAWGSCIYFERPAALSNTVILDPRFLTKDILAQLFNPQLASTYKSGVIRHADLIHFWPKCTHHIPTVFALMEKFEVAFRLRETPEGSEDGASGVGGGDGTGAAKARPKDLRSHKSRASHRTDLSLEDEERFLALRSVVPSLLPLDPPQPALGLAWPTSCPFELSQLERMVVFSVIPREMVARLLVRVHPYLHRGLV